MVDYGIRLDAALKAADKSVTWLAKELNLSYQGVRKVINGGTKSFTAANNAKAATLLDVSAEWLATGHGKMRDQEWQVKVTVRRIPYFHDPVRAGAFSENTTPHAKEDADDWLPAPIQGASEECFAIPMLGESMDAPGGYAEGEILYIDPQANPTPGKDVLAKLGHNKYTFKRYKVDDQGPYLLALNGNHIIRPIEPWSICGVCVFSGIKR